MKRALVEHVLRSMRTYLAECAAHKTRGEYGADELNDVIRACAESLIDHRRRQCVAADPRFALDPLGHAMRYIGYQIDANLARDHVVSHLRMREESDAAGFPETHSRLNRGYRSACP